MFGGRDVDPALEDESVADEEPLQTNPSDDSVEKKRKRAEAVLFLSKTPLSLRKLAQLAHLADATEARTLVRDLNSTYETYGRAFRVELIAGGYRLMTRAALSPWLTRLGHLPLAMRLSTPMMETLAVVAYRQPVSRADIESIRGVACGDLLRQLMEKDLVRIAGRSEELGRPYLYGTTKRFLQLFGLANTDSLPPIQWQILQEDQPDPAAENEAQETLDSTSLDPSPNDNLPSTKESVVSTAVASVLSEADSDVLVALGPAENSFDPNTEIVDDPQSIIEDEEDELYGDDIDEDDDDVDDDWDDDDDDDDLDDDDDEDDDDLDDDDLDEDDDEVDDENADWEEVDDDEEDDDWDDEDEDDDWEDEDDDDEDWT
ncbi:Prokaryotic chromosome segregation and condensation protein ScpB [Rhodopirellula maiorica SM1]|uniref:Prokaryotic chromosome segregation and condensation protein ScpB n=1 Tax=Rhodopirellula maiorica SM1 TaxID=1265738 RepID=M5RZC3_9BACT|nr:Prokaryotic chromosome segregation and condensation protein ScpB [Rhodopirellula maiorica SM1]